jgi:hypothetical protein
MSSRSPPPPIIHVKAAYEAAVRKLADDAQLTYRASPQIGRPGVVEFRFEAMDNTKLTALLGAIPADAFAYRARLGG